MTAKEVEHFLIENDFTYDKDGGWGGGYWTHRSKKFLSVSDDTVSRDPAAAYSFVKEQLGL